MKIRANSLNGVIYDFMTSVVLPKYADVWRKQGENNYIVDSKLFGLTAISKLVLKDDFSTKFPMIKVFCDADGNIDLDVVKDVLIDTYNEFKSKDKKVVLPYIDWELDAEDITKLYELAKDYEIKD